MKYIKTWNLGYEKAKAKAKNIYSKIGRIKCPALDNDYISFNRVGFNHLIRKGRIPRTKNDQKKRFVLLAYAEKILKNPRAVILYKNTKTKEKVNRYGEKILIESEANFWTFIEHPKGCVIKIVVRQINNGNKHFFSIMGNNIQTNNKKNTRPKIKKSLHK